MTNIDDIIKIAKDAGQAILEVYHTDFDTAYKEDQSPLTQADLASHQLILASLQALSPDIPVLSEESKAIAYEERKGWTTFWMVDPLDGTKEFVKRNGEFTVNIALIEHGNPILGVVHSPILETTYSAAHRQGSFKTLKDGEPQKIQMSAHKTGSLNVVASRSHAGAETEALLNKLRQDYPDLNLVSIGSSLKLCLVAEGNAHLYPRLGPTMEWDTAAAQCVVEQAGGKVLNLEGKSLAYNKENLLNPFFMVTDQNAAKWLAYL